MSKARDYLSDLRRYHLPNARTKASNAWHRAAGRHIRTARGWISNARAERAQRRGRRDLPRRAADSLRSSLPVFRNRIDPATGRPNRDSRGLGRATDRELARWAPQRREAARAPGASRTVPVRTAPVSRAGRNAADVVSRARADHFLRDRAARDQTHDRPGRSSR